MPPRTALPPRPSLRRADRLALLRALAGYGCAYAPEAYNPGPQLGTWRRLQAAGLLDAATPVPGAEPPAITEAGLRALGLPVAVAGAEEALRTAVQLLLPFRRPRIRTGSAMDGVHTDDQDDETAPPVSWTAHPMTLATISTEAEDEWELRGHDASLGWDAVEAWVERVGFPMEISRHADARVVTYDPEGECAHIAWVDGAWQREPPGGWGSLFAEGAE